MTGSNALEIPWKRAKIHEETMRLFRIEAEKKNPDYTWARKQVWETHCRTLPPRHANAARRQLYNLTEAANLAQRTRDYYKDKPDEACLSLVGIRLEGATLEKTLLSVPIVISKRGWLAFHRVLARDEYPGLHPIVREMIARLKAWDSEGVMGLLSETNPELPQQAKEARRRFTQETGIPFTEAASLMSLNTSTPGIRHEEKHMLSFILNRGTRRTRPPYEELRAHWAPWPWWKLGTATRLLEQVEKLREAPTKKAHVAERLLKALEYSQGRFRRDPIGLRTHLDAIESEVRRQGIALPKRLAENPNRLREQLLGAMEAAKLQEDYRTLRGLGEINRLQKKHGLSDDLIWSLLGTNDAAATAGIIRHNVTKRK